MPLWIYNLPHWQMLALFAGVAICICWSLLAVLKPVLARWFQNDHESRNSIIDILIAGTGLFYGLLLGLVAVGAYTNYANADDSVSREADAVGVLYRDVSNFPEPQRSVLRAGILHYIDVVTNDEFPSAHRGELRAAASPVATEIHKSIVSYSPTTYGGEAMDSEALRQFADVIAARNQRLNQMTAGLPNTLWFVLIAGAVINLALIAMLGIQKLPAHLMFSGMFAIFLGLMLFLIADLDHPFLGQYSVSAEAFETIRNVVIPYIG